MAWFQDAVTEEREVDGEVWGRVLGGRPITAAALNRPDRDLALDWPERTIRKWLAWLEQADLVRRFITPDGMIVFVRSNKFHKDSDRRKRPFKLPPGPEKLSTIPQDEGSGTTVPAGTILPRGTSVPTPGTSVPTPGTSVPTPGTAVPTPTLVLDSYRDYTQDKLAGADGGWGVVDNPTLEGLGEAWQRRPKAAEVYKGGMSKDELFNAVVEIDKAAALELAEGLDRALPPELRGLALWVRQKLKQWDPAAIGHALWRLSCEVRRARQPKKLHGWLGAVVEREHRGRIDERLDACQRAWQAAEGRM